MPSEASGPRPRRRPSMRRPRAARWHHTRCRWPTCPSNQRRRAPFGSRCRSPRREGPRSRRNAPCVRPSTTPAEQCWNTWRGTRCTLRPRRTTRRRPPTSCRGEHGDPRGTPRTPGAPRPRQPTTQMEVRRHPERPRGPAVRPTRVHVHPRGAGPPGPPGSPGPPGPPVGPAGNGLSGCGAPRCPGGAGEPGGDADAG